MAAPRFVEVAVSVPVTGTFTYAVPNAWAEAPPVGAMALVPFGRRKISAIVLGPASPPEGYEALPLHEVQAHQSLPADVVGLCRWLAEYYAAPVGEALRLATPPGSHTATRTVYAWTTEGQAAWQADGFGIGKDERALLAALAAGGGKLRALTPSQKQAMPGAITRGWVVEKVLGQAAVSLKQQVMIALAPDVDVAAAQVACGRSGKQRAVLQALHEAAQQGAAQASDGLPMRVLVAEVPGAAAAVKALIARGHVITHRTAMTLEPAVVAALGGSSRPGLNPHQADALAYLRDRLDGFSCTLLFGVTGSGKTEVYLHVIEDVLARGRGALLLVPEISLTPLVAARFRARFGDAVAVLHSGLTPRERYDEWQRLQRGEAVIAVGARSAVFAPVANLGVIVVDEEHDGSYKQDDGVRYHGRDVAIMRAKQAGIPCLLGSATPSFESYFAAQSERYGLLALPVRAVADALPAVTIIDMRRYRAEATSLLTAPLRQALADTLASGGQSILLLNRRGFASSLLCETCGAPVQCKHCAVSMTWHEYARTMICHYCGYQQPRPPACPACGGASLGGHGVGTEQIATAIAAQFPTARIGRLDRDTGRREAIERVLQDVEEHAIDILVGTQMVAKGHDFANVTLVGVLCADIGLSLPDFRASERTYQLISQVAGRAGRGKKGGQVLIQTYRPEATCIAFAQQHDYPGFYAAELATRDELDYPPRVRMFAWHIDGSVDADAARIAEALAQSLRRHAGELVLVGPAPAPLTRLKGRFRYQLWGRGAPEALKAARAVHAHFMAKRGVIPAGVRVTLDVDPVSTL
ncbi:MAG: primosomal protein N' [Myxococcales bacterium]|nr:primosomal protein N' [Myxococcales bacterium]